MSKKKNKILLIYKVYFIYIKIVILSIFMTNFLIKIDFIIFCKTSFKKLVNKKRIKSIDIKK